MHCNNYFVRNTAIALMLSLELAAVGCSGQSSSPGNNNNNAAAGKQKALVQDAASATLAGADSLPAADPVSVPNPTTAADPALEPNSTAVNNPPPEQNLGALLIPIPATYPSYGRGRYNSINVTLKRSLTQPQLQPSKSTTQTLAISQDFAASDQAPQIKDVPPGNYDVSVNFRESALATGPWSITSVTIGGSALGSVTIDAGKTTTATVQVGCPPGGGPYGIHPIGWDPPKREPVPVNTIKFFEACMMAM